MTLITATETGLPVVKQSDRVAQAAAVGILQLETGLSACPWGRLLEVVAVMMRNLVSDEQHRSPNPVIMVLDIMSHDGRAPFEPRIKTSTDDEKPRRERWVFSKGNKPMQVTLRGKKMFREDTPAGLLHWWIGYVSESVKAIQDDPAYYDDIREEFAFIAHAILRECTIFADYNGIVALLCYYQLLRLLGIPIERHVWRYENRDDYLARLDRVLPFVHRRIAEFNFVLPQWNAQTDLPAQR